MKNRHAAIPWATATVILPGVASRLLSMQTALAWLGTARTIRARHMRALRSLQAMNDRELRDIGLTPNDVRAIINGHYRPD